VRENADAAGPGECFEPCCDIDAVPNDVVSIDDHVTDIDPDPEFEAVLRRLTRQPFGHCVLPFHRAPLAIDDAAELDKQAIAGGLDYTAPYAR
jgi:hypothetical protein